MIYVYTFMTIIAEINYDELLEDMRDKQKHEEHIEGGADTSFLAPFCV
eukprot:COSAG06_NODE_254_length_19039_cov_5.465488_1_plen_48_part_00